MSLYDQFELPDPSPKKRASNAVAATLGTIFGLTPNVAILVTHSLPEWAYWLLMFNTLLSVLVLLVRASLFTGKQ